VATSHVGLRAKNCENKNLARWRPHCSKLPGHDANGWGLALFGHVDGDRGL
jgi:hypothetical protein